VKFDWQPVDDGDGSGIMRSLHLVPVRIPAATFGTSCSLLTVCSGRQAKQALEWFKLNETKAGANTSASERACCCQSGSVPEVKDDAVLNRELPE